MYKIYVAAIEPLMEDGFYQQALSMVGKDRQIKTEKMIQRQDKARSLAAGLLLRHAVKDCTEGNDGGELGKQLSNRDTGFCWDGSCFVKEHGKPMLPKELGLYFNLSHSGDYVLCAVSDKETGADIQRHEKYVDRLAKRFFHPEELAYLKKAEDPKQRFYDLWCLKESCIKCTGRGLSTGLESFSVVPFFYGEPIVLDGIRCVGECAPAYRKTELKDFTEIYTEEPIKGYSMAVTVARADVPSGAGDERL